ncbi:MAG: c-type cytochrome [Thermomicrobiales bacterium]
MRMRVTFLLMTIGIAVVAVACGRASDRQIDAALGITPTPTLSAGSVATGTSSAIAEGTRRAQARAALGSPGANGSPASLAAAGDVVQGKSAFQLRCLGCHQASGAGRAPALKGPANPSVALSDGQLQDLIRKGTKHPVPPGPYTTVDISDRQLINILAFLRDQAK